MSIVEHLDAIHWSNDNFGLLFEGIRYVKCQLKDSKVRAILNDLFNTSHIMWNVHPCYPFTVLTSLNTVLLTIHKSIAPFALTLCYKCLHNSELLM